MQYDSASASERRYLPPAVAVSVVAFALRPPAEAVIGAAGRSGARADETTLWIPLVRRTRAPFQGRWALPGGPTQWDETLSDTALRSLGDAVLRDPGTLEQLYSFGGVERSAEAQRLVTIAYWALYGEHEIAADPEPRSRGGHRPPAAGPGDAATGAGSARRWDDPAPAIPLPEVPQPAAPHPAVPQPATTGGGPDPNVAWFSADELPELAFDHAEIIAYALARLRSKTEYAAVAHRFLGPVFTLGRLRAVTEAVLGDKVDPANFRRQALAQGNLVDTGERETGTPHRPARLYRFQADPEPASPDTRSAA